MSKIPDSQINKNREDLTDLYDFFYILWNKKFSIGAITSIFAVFSILYSLMLPNIYKSEAVMMPMEAENQMSGILGQYSGMANLAGIRLPSDTGSKHEEAIARIHSFEFFSNNFLPYIKLENLLAVRKWNQENNTLIYDESTFNPELLEWLPKSSSLKKINTPSTQKAYKKYKEIISVDQNNKTIFIKLSVQHQSPFIAKNWAEIIIRQIDKVMRDEEKNTTLQSIEFLKNLTPTVYNEEIKESLFLMQQEQLKKLMMIEVNNNYVFNVIDPPIVPEMKSEPKRSFIVILGCFFGIILSIICVLIHHFIKKSF